MSFIAMWIAKRINKKKIRNIIKNGVKADKSNIKRLQRINRIYTGIAIVISMFILAVTITLTITIVTKVSYMAALAGNTILQIFEDDEKKEEDKDKGKWTWDKLVGAGPPDTGTNNGSGGLYPKDPQLRLRAEMIEIIKKSCDDAAEHEPFRVEPAWVMGTMYRETSNKFYNLINQGNISSLYKDLVVPNPSCTKGGGCAYLRAGISHFHGGSVANGVDQGDPTTQVINTSKTTYGNMGGDHAIGFVQFEIPFIYDPNAEFNKIYENPEPVTTSLNPEQALKDVTMDSDLGFIRPNILYMPDQIYNTAFSLSSKPRLDTGSHYSDVTGSADFQSLSEYNQNYLRFVYATSGYVRGSLTGTPDKMVRELIAVAKSGAIENLDDMLLDVADKYWDADGIMGKGERAAAAKHIQNTYGLTIPWNVDNDWLWCGIFAGCTGKVQYTKMMELIDAAEKDGVANEPDKEEDAPAGNDLETFVQKYVGCPYVWGGLGAPLTEAIVAANGPNSGHNIQANPNWRDWLGMPGYDCSGLAVTIWKEYFNVSLPVRQTGAMAEYGTEIDPTDSSLWEPGDLMFSTYRNPGHVVIYIGNNKTIEATQSGDICKIKDVSARKIVRVKRPPKQ